MTVEKATPAKAAELTQDPPRARDGPEKTLELAIGRALRGFRRRQEVTVAELANRTGLSIGMLSKIENGNTSPSQDIASPCNGAVHADQCFFQPV